MRAGLIDSDGGGMEDILGDVLPLHFLPPEKRSLVARSFVPSTHAFGSVIVREGDPADAFYVIASGRVRVIKTGERGEEVSLGTLGPGEGFGEMGLLNPDAKRTATVRASGDVEVLRLDRVVFDTSLKSHPDIRMSFELQSKHRSLQNFFRLFGPFTKLPPMALKKLLGRFQEVQFRKGDLVFREGDPPGPLYVIFEGRLRVFTDADGRRRPLSYLRKGDFFGEIAAFGDQARRASVEAVTDCRLQKLDAASCQEVARENPDFHAAIQQHIALYDTQREARVPLDFSEEILPADASIESVTRTMAGDDLDDASDPSAVTTPFQTGGRFIKGSKRIRSIPFVRQIDEMDCGPAALAMICRHYGRAVGLSRIRKLLATSTDGASLKAICRGAEELGLAARAVKASHRHLDQMPLPAIVHWGGNHWVIAYDVTATHVRVVDPAIGDRQVPRAEFEKDWTGYAALFDYTTDFEKAPVGEPSASWLGAFFKPHTTTLLRATVLALIVGALQLVLPVFTQIIVDRVLVDRDESLLRVLLLGMGSVLIFSTIAMVLQRYLLSFVAVRVDASTLDFLTRRLLSLPMSYFNTRRTGDIQRRLQGLRQVREFVVQQGVAGLTAATQLFVVLILMFIYSPRLVGVFLLTAPIYALLMRFSSQRLRPIFASLEEAFGKYASQQIDAIKGIETVKTLAAERALRHRMVDQFHAVARKQFRADFTMMSYDGAVQAVTFLSTALFLWAGTLEVLGGRMTIGGLVAFNALVALAHGPILTLLSLWDHLQLGRVLMDRLADVVDQEPEQGSDRSRLAPVRTLEGRIAFRNVSFRYGGVEAPLILEDITLDVPPGKMVAIVGRSGSGKTTLVKLLSGLLEPTSGAILFDGVDMATLNFRDLRRRVGFVLQDNHLFDDTIARNIAFGEEEPDLDQVLWAARVASAHEFIERLPLGYDTRVGESGLALSGGQKQRIAIARAIYSRPPILIFDEATSALDAESERAVKDNLDRLLEGRTSFVIAQRLSTIRNAHVILVMEKGRLVEHGTHDELMDRQGLYYYLCSQQIGA